MLLYHTGFDQIKEPDVHYGRKNADFGQGFYLTAESEFAHRWAGEKKDARTYVNSYELNTDGLVIHRFQRDEEWFQYIYGNRHLKPDTLEADVIIGPIANDTIYDTLGIVTSGFLEPEEAMQLLMIGPEYQQITLKTKKAAEHLQWLGAEELSSDEIAKYHETVAAEEAEYQRLFAAELEKLQ